jgi:NitT/TauT family transport system substrate-binding protein
LRVAKPSALLARSAALFLAAAAAFLGLPPEPALAAERVNISSFQGTFVSFPLYVAHDLQLFEKHGVAADLVYGTGIQVTNILLSGSAEFGAFAVEHGLAVIGKGQDLRLVVLAQAVDPLSLIARDDIPLPHEAAPYPQMLSDLKGLKIGISTVGASTDITLRFLLDAAGLNPQADVTIVPVGAPPSEVATLKNHTIDALVALEPAQTELVSVLHIAKPVLDMEKGEGPAIFKDYAYNGVFARESYLKDHADTVRAVVAAIVEAETLINDPAHFDDIAKVAENNMRGLDPRIVRLYIEQYRASYRPVATRQGIANVNTLLVAAKQVSEPVPYDRAVAKEFMPTSFQTSTAK